MALSRFLLAKPVFYFHTRGILKSTRWLSSSSSSNGGTQKFSHVKGVEGAKGNGHMEMHLKVLPEVTEVETKAGGSWYSLKCIFTILKDQIFGYPQSHKQTDDSEHIAESGGSNNVLKSSEIPTDSNSTEESISTCTTSHLQERQLSEDSVNTTASAVMEMHGSPDNNKLNEHDSTVQAASVIISDNPKEFMLENGKMLLEEPAFGAESNNNLKEGGHINSFAHHLFDDALDTRQDKSANELASIRNAKCQFEKKTATLVERVNVDGSNLDKRPPSSDGSQEDDGLMDLFNTAAGMGSVNGDLSTPSESFSYHDGTLLKNVGSSFAFDDLIGHIKTLPQVPAEDNAMCAIDNIQSRHELQGSNVDSRKTVLKGRAVSKNSEKRSKVKKEQNAKTMTKDEGGNLHIVESDHIAFDDIIGHIKTRPRVSVEDNAMCAIDNIQSPDELQGSNVDSRKTVLSRAVSKNSEKRSKVKKEQSAKTMTKDEGGNLHIVEKDHIKLEKSPQVPLQTSKKDSNQTPITCLAEGNKENKVWLRFLHKDVRDSDIISCFKICGPISKIEKVSSVKGSNFFDAFLHFKTRKGVQKALENSELLLRNSNAFIEETSIEDTANRISIPNLIDDIDIPIALVKHPTRTVKIKQLTNDISSQQLKEALSFCGSGINGFFRGTSSSNAYVEFESEDAKERALAKHLVQLSGKHLLIFRVDAPRTTVVRILNINPQCRDNVLPICKSFGKPMKRIKRHESIVDVYFKIDEWPNMLNILNSLNGLEVDGSRWVAQPAPIFPPIILQALWNHPDERRRVITAMQYLMKKVEHPTDTAELNNLAAKFYGDSL